MTHSLTQKAHAILSALLKPGDWAVDATLGNGHDTLFLSACVGEAGRVFGFDVQPVALEKTRARLGDYSAKLFLAGHETMGEHLPQEAKGTVRAIMFNLGYLPGSDKTTITQTATTLKALDAALQFLAPGGALSVMIYPGHPGGASEATAVRTYLQGLPPSAYSLQIERSPKDTGPELWVLMKK